MGLLILTFISGACVGAGIMGIIDERRRAKQNKHSFYAKAAKEAALRRGIPMPKVLNKH